MVSKMYLVVDFLITCFVIQLLYVYFSAVFKNTSYTNVWHLTELPHNPEEKFLCIMHMS